MRTSMLCYWLGLDLALFPAQDGAVLICVAVWFILGHDQFFAGLVAGVIFISHPKIVQLR